MSTAFSGIVKLLSELTEQTTAADTDIIPIGATSPRKITFANLRKALGLDRIVYSFTNPYFDVRIIKCGNVKHIQLAGFPKQALTSGTLYTLADGVSADLMPQVNTIKNILFAASATSIMTLYVQNNSVSIRPAVAMTTSTATNVNETYI